MTGKRNIQPRLKTLLEAEGLQGRHPPADDVEPIEREEWIEQHGREYDVMISPPAAGQHRPRPVQQGAGRAQLLDHRLLRDRVQPLHHAAGRPPGLADRPAPRLPGLLPLLQGDHAAQGHELDVPQDGGGPGPRRRVLRGRPGRDGRRGQPPDGPGQELSPSGSTRPTCSATGARSSPAPRRRSSSKLDTALARGSGEVNAATAAQIIAETMEETEGKEPPIEASPEFAGVLERIANVDANFMVATKDVTPTREAARAPP